MIMERFFLAVISTSLSASLIVLLLIALTPVLKQRYASGWRYILWIMLALHLVLPLQPSDVRAVGRDLNGRLSAAFGAEQEGNDTEMNVRTDTAVIRLEIPAQLSMPLLRPAQGTVSAASITILTILEMIWLLGCVVLFTVYLWSYLAYRHQIRRHGRRLKDPVLCQKMRAAADNLQIRRAIPVIRYAGAFSPMILGFFRPVLILPDETYSEEELFFILRHELTHLKRGDLFWKLLFVLANTIHWFNPVIWLMRREAVIDLELSCDESVVRGADHQTRKAYTEMLFSTLYRKKDKRKTALSSQFYGGKKVMKRRFQNILRRSAGRRGILPLSCAIILGICLSLMIGCAKEAPEAGMLRHEDVFIEEPEQTDKETDNITEQENDTAGVSKTLQEESSDTGSEVQNAENAAVPDRIMMTFMMEGEPEEQPATLFWGDGYSIYVPDDDWRQYADDAWMSVHNEAIRFWVTRYEDRTTEEVMEELQNTAGLEDLIQDDQELAVRGEWIRNKDNMVTHVRLVEYGTDVWSICYCYPEEAVEGAGTRLPVIVDTFAVTTS